MATDSVPPSGPFETGLQMETGLGAGRHKTPAPEGPRPPPGAGVALAEGDPARLRNKKETPGPHSPQMCPLTTRLVSKSDIYLKLS